MTALVINDNWIRVYFMSYSARISVCQAQITEETDVDLNEASLRSCSCDVPLKDLEYTPTFLDL